VSDRPARSDDVIRLEDVQQALTSLLVRNTVGIDPSKYRTSTDAIASRGALERVWGKCSVSIGTRPARASPSDESGGMTAAARRRRSMSNSGVEPVGVGRERFELEAEIPPPPRGEQNMSITREPRATCGTHGDVSGPRSSSDWAPPHMKDKWSPTVQSPVIITARIVQRRREHREHRAALAKGGPHRAPMGARHLWQLRVTVSVGRC
jgi:hypothetical protein